MAHAARLVTVPNDPDATEPAPPRPPAGSATYSQAPSPSGTSTPRRCCSPVPPAVARSESSAGAVANPVAT